MDMIYHGTEDEKDQISFMMLDEVGLGKITFPFYENFLIQFYNMYGQLLQTNTIEQDKCHEIAREVFTMIAAVDLPEDSPEEKETGSSPPKGRHSKLILFENQPTAESPISHQSGKVSQKILDPKSKESIVSTSLDAHLVKAGKRLTEAEKAEF